MLLKCQDENLIFQRSILVIIAKLLDWVEVEENVTNTDATSEYKKGKSVLLKVSYKAFETWSQWNSSRY